MMRLPCLLIFVAIVFSSCEKRSVSVVSASNSSRVVFGTEKLKASLKDAGYEVLEEPREGVPVIRVGLIDSISMVRNISGKTPGKEGFIVKSDADGIIVAGSDESGALYGCIDLADMIDKEGELPSGVNKMDEPEMVLRGACIGLQKPTYLPGRTVYEYPYTPQNFPWFYDKALWIKYLDMLAENRMNSLYLWNGHPFASLVKLEDYPYAVEVDEETFRKNEEMFAFLTQEADKRGIWVIQMFYNIIVSKPFAEKHNIKTQDRSRPIIPLIEDYTQKSIAAFIEKYPNVGLLVALGEAINTVEDDVEWFTKTVIPGVKDGLKALGRTDEPPIILRAHDTDAKKVMDAALPLYKNLYTAHKYNGESLTTYEPRGPWSKIHQDLSALGSIHISNVHILANLEPFRYGSPDFIQKSVQAMHNVHGANALHLYPQASYWDWPYSADKTSPRLLEMERDWIWYKAWARYAWHADRKREDEIQYWSDKLGAMYGCPDCGEDILKAYEGTGEIAPKLLRRFGITEGNRQTLLLGMFMSQLVNPYKWRVYPGFYESCGPVGEILIEYAEKEWNGTPHTGETPQQIIDEVTQHAKVAVEAIEKAAPEVMANNPEFERLRNDVHCYDAFARYFAAKVKAAMLVLRHSYSKNIADLENSVPLLEESVREYERLVDLTKDAYLYANSMQTKQRRIPIGGDDGKNKTWEEMLTHYREELGNLKKNIRFLKASGGEGKMKEKIVAWKNADVVIIGEQNTLYSLQEGVRPYKDRDFKISGIAEEVAALEGVKGSWQNQLEDGISIRFKLASPAKLLVGYFRSERIEYLSPPTLETDAQANDRGQAEVILTNAVSIDGLPPVNIHSYSFESGEHVLKLGKGTALLIGFVDASQKMAVRDAGLGEADENVDWVFY
jgi:hypothetical protein